MQRLFPVAVARQVASRVAYLEDYDLAMAARLVAGCDVWVNLPRPLEASGTSGMKAVLNGGLHLSVLDGWWEEACDGQNGWGIASDPLLEADLQDTRDASSLYSCSNARSFRPSTIAMRPVCRAPGSSASNVRCAASAHASMPVGCWKTTGIRSTRTAERRVGVRPHQRLPLALQQTPLGAGDPDA